MLRVVALVVLLGACGRAKPAVSEPAAEPPPSRAAPAQPGDGLPDGAVASVDGRLIGYDELANAYRREVIDRDELTGADAQRILGNVMDALIFDELLQVELARLGFDEEAEIQALLADAHPQLAMTPLALPSMGPEWAGGGLALALLIARRVHVVDAEQVNAAYDRRKHERTSSLGWVRLDVLAVGYVPTPNGSTGIPICDDLLQRWDACARTPGALLDRRAIEPIEAMIRDGLRDPARPGAAASLCVAMAEQVAIEGAATLGCDWNQLRPSASVLAAGRAATRKRAVALRRRASTPDADFSALAREDRSASARTELVAIDTLEPELARAVAKLQPPGVTAAIAGAASWTIARVRERWPAGPAPLDLWGEELAQELVAARIAAELDGLYARLRASHHVVVRLPPPPKVDLRRP